MKKFEEHLKHIPTFIESTPNEIRRAAMLPWLFLNNIDIDGEYEHLRPKLRNDLAIDIQFKSKTNALIDYSTKNGEDFLRYVNTLSKFIDLHDRFYDNNFLFFVESILNKPIDAIPKRVLHEIHDLLILNFDIDHFHIVISGAAKKITELNAERIVKEQDLPEDAFLHIITPTHTIFLKEYTVKHSFYFNSNNIEQKEAILEELAVKYHLGSKELALNRINREFKHSKLMPKSDSLVHSEHSASNSTDLSIIEDMVNFDNYYEYMYAKKLEGLAGFTLRLYLLKVLAENDKLNDADYPLSKSTEVKMIDLIDQKLQDRDTYFSTNLDAYEQTTPITCGAASALMVEHYFKSTPMNRKKEHEIYSICNMEGLDGTHESAIALYLKKAGLEVRIVHERNDLLTYWDGIDNATFEKAEKFYREKFVEAVENGVESIISKIDANSFVEQLDDGYIPIASVILPSGVLHSLVLTGYAKHENGVIEFEVIDPIGNNHKVSNSELDTLISLPFGKVFVAASGFLRHAKIANEILNTYSELNDLRNGLRL